MFSHVFIYVPGHVLPIYWPAAKPLAITRWLHRGVVILAELAMSGRSVRLTCPAGGVCHVEL